MQPYILIVAGVLTLLCIFLVWQNYRFLNTIHLITQTTPYTQAGNGAGTILIIGDSTGYGTGVRDPQKSIAGLLGKNYPNYRIKNNSHNGDTINEARDRVKEITGTYDLILLQLGANDVLQRNDLQDIQNDLTALYETLQPHTSHFIMMSLGNVGAVPAFSSEDARSYERLSLEFHAVMEDFAANRNDFTYVNLYEDPITDPFVANPNTYLARDGLHPTAVGYARWYERLQPILADVLLKKKTSD